MLAERDLGIGNSEICVGLYSIWKRGETLTDDFGDSLDVCLVQIIARHALQGVDKLLKFGTIGSHRFAPSERKSHAQS